MIGFPCRTSWLLALGACGRLEFAPDADASADTGVVTDAACTWSAWSHPQPIASLSSATDEVAGAFSPDDQSLVFMSTRSGDEDLWLSTRQGLSWSAPVMVVATNTNFLEDDPTWTADGTQLYFATNRSGNFRIWVSDNAGGVLGAPYPATGLETTFGLGPALSPNGLEMIFTSISNVLQRATRVATVATWNAGANVGELDSGAQDGWPSLTRDGLTIYFSSTRGGGPTDIYVATRPAIDQPFGPPEPVLEVDDSVADDGNPEISHDGTTLIFDSNRLGGAGGFDLYSTTRSCL